MSDCIEQEHLLPIGEVARLLGVSVDTVRRWEQQQKITSIRTLGGQRRFQVDDVTALAEAEAEAEAVVGGERA